jgi:hypothetical protein
MKPIDTSKTDVEFDALITRMIELARTSTALGIEAEAIGRELFALGGIEAMQSALYIFSGVWGTDPLSKLSPILPMDWVLVWQDVGEWAL